MKALFNIGFGIVLVLVVLYLIGVVGGSTISIGTVQSWLVGVEDD